MAIAVVAAMLALSPVSAGGPAAKAQQTDIEIVGVVLAGGPITGGVLFDGYLYVTTPDRVAIYDTSNEIAPALVGTQVSPNDIYGEMLTTDGETLLLNHGYTIGTVDVWNVEDKTNPVLVATVNNVLDEHVSCLLECSWAYGSDGTILDLRDPTDPRKTRHNWKDITGEIEHMHRVDEFRTGFMATAPRRGAPVVLDVRRPLRPRVVARGGVPAQNISGFLHSGWPRAGSDRFMMTSTEVRRCSDDQQGALVTFDTKGWPKDRVFEVAGAFKYQGRTDNDEHNCNAYYPSIHPDFADGGLVLLPNAFEGVRIVDVDRRGKMAEIDAFVPPISDLWLAFWVDDEIFYALNRTGEIYILRYVP